MTFNKFLIELYKWFLVWLISEIHFRFNLENNALPETILFQTNKKGNINGTTFYGAEFSAEEMRDVVYIVEALITSN